MSRGMCFETLFLQVPARSKPHWVSCPEIVEFAFLAIYVCRLYRDMNGDDFDLRKE